MSIQALLDARLQTLGTRIANNLGNADELIKEFAQTATARYSAVGSTDPGGGVIGATETQVHTLVNGSITIPAGCKIIYLVCQLGTVILTTTDILNTGNATHTLTEGDYINLEYAGSAGHGEIAIDATSGTLLIAITK